MTVSPTQRYLSIQFLTLGVSENWSGLILGLSASALAWILVAGDWSRSAVLWVRVQESLEADVRSVGQGNVREAGRASDAGEEGGYCECVSQSLNKRYVQGQHT